MKIAPLVAASALACSLPLGSPARATTVASSTAPVAAVDHSKVSFAAIQKCGKYGYVSRIRGHRFPGCSWAYSVLLTLFDGSTSSTRRLSRKVYRRTGWDCGPRKERHSIVKWRCDGIQGGDISPGGGIPVLKFNVHYDVN